MASDEVLSVKRVSRIIGMAHHALEDPETGNQFLIAGLSDATPRKSNGELVPIVKPDSDLKGKSIIIYCASGRGDSIQFSRFIPDLRKLGLDKIYYLDEKKLGLESLMSRIGEFNGLYTKEDQVPHADFCAEWHNLVYMFPTTSGSYEWLKPKLEPVKNRIGICTRGGAGTPRDEWRSMPDDIWTPITSLDGFRFVSLSPDHDIPKVSRVLSGGCSYEDTIEVLSKLSLLITVDTSVAHLAGALGVPTWLLLAPPTDWRWGVSGETTRWYDSVRIFRANKHKEWIPVIERVASDLKAL